MVAGVSALVAVAGFLLLVALRVGPPLLGWRASNQWAKVAEAIRRQPELLSVDRADGSPVILYRVGDDSDDVIEAALRPNARIEAKSAVAREVLERALADLGDSLTSHVEINWPQRKT